MKQEFLNCYLHSDSKPTYKQVSQELSKKTNKTFTVEKIKKLYKEENGTLVNIQKLRVLHTSIKKRSGQYYGFQGFFDFYTWYQETDKNCCYCGVSESTLKSISKNGWTTKRSRGKKLEVERVDSNPNLYNRDNCKLACYFCNNHKSDFISKEHYEKYFATPMKNYLEEISQIKNPNPHLNTVPKS